MSALDSSQLSVLVTESRDPNTVNIDRQDPEELVRILHSENHTVAAAVDIALPQIAQAVELIADRLSKGGRLIYVGAGTSGRLGVLDASECPPTFGVSPEVVQGIIAGGDTALRSSVEGAEDIPESGASDLQARNVGSMDVVVGIAASGRTPYVCGALEVAKSLGAETIAVVNVPNSELSILAGMTIACLTGPEAITGSTRLKAGTAQKMVLNLLTTGAMVRMGKTYGNLMVDVAATNEKLKRRAVRIVCEATGCADDVAEQALSECGFRAKVAIVMVLRGVGEGEAEELLRQNGGFVGPVIKPI